MGDAELDTLVIRYLQHRDFDRFVRELVEEGYERLLPQAMLQERRRAVAKAKLDRAKREYDKACR